MGALVPWTYLIDCRFNETTLSLREHGHKDGRTNNQTKVVALKDRDSGKDRAMTDAVAVARVVRELTSLMQKHSDNKP